MSEYEKNLLDVLAAIKQSLDTIIEFQTRLIRNFDDGFPEKDAD